MNRERLSKPIEWLDFTLGLLLGILLTTLVGLFIDRSEAEAAPSVGIKCRIDSVTTVQRTARISIKSNKPIHYGQTSVQFSYLDADRRQKWVTRDEGYGAVVTVVRPASAREWGLFRAWHAGTKCREYAVGGPF